MFCLRAAEAVVADEGSVGVVIGGSGNGEQIAANKVRGVRAALVWSELTASLAREHNDANVISIGGRMHSLDEMTRFIEIFLATDFSDEERHDAGSDACRLRDDRGVPPLPESLPPTAPMPEGHTLRRLANDLSAAFAGGPVRVSSPQGRFGADAALVDGQPVLGAVSAGKHLFIDSR